MHIGRHDRQVSLNCPTCGNTQFEVLEIDAAPVVCARCGRALTREELVRENAENLTAQVEEMKAQVIGQVQRDLSEMLRKAFSGNKNFRIR